MSSKRQPKIRTAIETQAFSLPPGFGAALLDFAYEWAQKSLAANAPVSQVKTQIKNPTGLNETRVELFTRRQLGLNGLRNRGKWNNVREAAMGAVRAELNALTEQDVEMVIANCVD